MSDMDIVRGWKDPASFAAPGEEHPVGDIDAMRHVHGGAVAITNGIGTYGCCEDTNSSLSCYFVC